MSLRLCRLLFSILLPLSATCASSYNGRVMPLKGSEKVLDSVLAGGGPQASCKRVEGSWWKHVVRVTATLSSRHQADQEVAEPVKVIPLPFYGRVLFYPSTECMSTECPVTSLL